MKEKLFAIIRMFVVLVAVMLLYIGSSYAFFFGIIRPIRPLLEALSPFLVLLINFSMDVIPRLLAILIGCLVITKIYKIKRPKLGMSFTTKWGSHFAKGLGIGFVSITIIWLVSILFGGYTVTFNQIDAAVLANVFLGFLSHFTVGYFEEGLTRGLMTFVGAKNQKWFNAIVAGMCFSLLHLLNPSYDLLSMVNTLLIAVVFSMLTWISGDLWVAIGYHAIWNFTLGFVFGVIVSGNDQGKSIFTSTPGASHLMSGGGYGLEASIVCTIAILIQMVLIYLFFIKKGKVSKDPVAPWLA